VVRFFTLKGFSPNNHFMTGYYSHFEQELRADRELAASMSEKSRMLQRGVLVSTDQAHEWGTHAFPNLLERTPIHRATLVQEAISIGEISEVDPDTPASGADESAIISEHIRQLTFSRVRNAIVLQIALFALFMSVQIPVLIIISELMKEDMLRPRRFFKCQALWRTQAYTIMAVSQQVIYTR
jgi:hypothetical protein